MEAFSEAEKFIVYWLHFFGRPMTSDGLRLLWENRAGAKRGGAARLPIAELASAGYVSLGKNGLITLNRAQLPQGILSDAWKVSESGEWAVPFSFVTSNWWRKAFKPTQNESYFSACDRVEHARLRHVLFRWGRKAARACVKGRRYGDEGKLGDDKVLYADVSKALRKYQEELPDRRNGPEGFADMSAVPDGMPKPLQDSYRNILLIPLGDNELGYFRDEMRTEEKALRRGGTELSAETEAEMVAHLAAGDFWDGNDTGWAVARLNALRRQAALSPHATALLLALAFWRNDYATIEALDRESPYCFAHRRRVTTALKLARDGAFAEADKELSSALGLMYYPMTDQWHVVDFPILLILLILKVRSGGGNVQGLKRMLRVMGDLASSDRFREDAATRRNLDWVQRFASVLPGVEVYEGRETPAPTRLPFVYLHVLAASLGYRHLKVVLPDALRMAKQALESGYPSMAADIMSVLPRLEELQVSGKASEAEFAAVGADPERVFAAPREMARFWERALDVLEKALPPALSKAKAAAKKKAEKEPDQLCWALEYVVDGRYGPFVGHAAPIVRRRSRDGTLNEPTVVSEKSFIDGKYDAIMTPEDAKVKYNLVASGCVSVDDYADKASATVETLRLLAGRDNLYCWASGYFYEYESLSRTDTLVPLTLAFETVKLALSYRPDGSVEITMPISLDELPVKSSYTVDRKTSQASESWRVLEVTTDYAKVVKALAQVSDGKKLVVPAEGAARVESICAGASSEAPIAWRQSDVRRKAYDVPRESATCVPSARLVFADGALVVAASVKLSEEPLWTSEPGRGAPERLVVRKDESRVLLTRDFAAEETAVVPVREALARFETAKTDANHWYFSGVEESLDALAVLHEASKDGAFALEWPEGESLKLTELVSHATRVEGGETADYWLGMSGEFQLDDGKVLSFVELLRSFDVREGAYVRLNDDRYLRLSAALARRLEVLKGAGIEQGGKIMISPAAVPALEKIARETEADDVLPLPEVVKARLGTIRAAFAKRVAEPSGLRCQMRPYQAEGFEWLSRLYDCGIGACLADDMGLGKTVQLISLLLAKKAEGPSLVVAPASVAFNWRDEIGRFAPTLKVALVGQTAGDADVDVSELAKASDVVITSYGVLSSREDKFAAVAWNALVLDEAQAIKNHLTKRAQSVKRLQARFRAVATGTPIENRLTELWSIFDFINPGMLGGETRFNRELAPHGEASPRLKRLVKPLILRRLKREVLTDLPEKEEITVNVVLGDEERHAYEATRLNALAKLEGGDKENKIAILAELTRLRRFCCHPSLVIPSMLASAKLEALADLLEDLRANNHRALVFSQFVDYLAIVRKLLEERGWSYKYLDGATPKSEREKGVAAFQAGEGDFYLISLKAGGMGLNLTAANYVILLDPWWNPAVENQAADRVHRIGQHLPVTVYRLIAQDTIEEKVVNLHAKKNALAEDVLASGASALSAEAMLSLLEG